MENQTTPIAPPSEPATTPQKPKIPLLVGMVILVLILLASTGYLAYQNYQLRRQISQLQTSPTPTLTPDPTANWKTYTNPISEYTLSYPSNWDFSSSNPNEILITGKKTKFVFLIKQHMYLGGDVDYEILNRKKPTSSISTIKVEGADFPKTTYYCDEQKTEFLSSNIVDLDRHWMLIAYETLNPGVDCVNIADEELIMLDQITASIKGLNWSIIKIPNN